MATHSSILAWRNPWTVACQAPLCMGVARFGYDLATKPPPTTLAFSNLYFLMCNMGLIIST